MLEPIRRNVARALSAVGAILSLAVASAAADASPAAPLEVKAELDRGVLAAGEAQKAILRVAIKPARHAGAGRALMNIALVIDRSGSMSSHGRIENARKAAQMAVDRLGADDILSVVSYDERVEVEVPATKVLSRPHVKARIAALTPRGSTAIHAGLLAAANEVRKFKSKDRVNRIVLLSDGLANVGPSRPQDFISLGHELASEGITVSTIGLGNGYNEDLMAGLARSADGGHVFVQESADLTAFLAREFDDAAGTVGQQAEVVIRVLHGARPLRSLGRDARIDADRLTYRIGALYGGAEQVLLAELDIPAALAAGEKTLAEVEIAYHDAASGSRVRTQGAVVARFSADRSAVERSANETVQRDVATLVSREARQEAVKLRDAGRLDEARAKFKANADYVREQQSRISGGAAYAPLTNELKASEEAASPASQSAEGWSKARKTQRATDGNSFGAGIKY